jgi:hypothetical protein
MELLDSGHAACRMAADIERRLLMSTAKSRRWSKQVAERSDALDLEAGVFAGRDPERIARSLLESAQHSTRRKSSPFRSAMSMLTFYVNRAGRNLPQARLKRLEAAKTALRKLCGRTSTG